MSWLCPICKGKTVNACEYCPSCKSRGKLSERPKEIDLSILDSYDILIEEIQTNKIYKSLEINYTEYERINKMNIDNNDDSTRPLTPEEEWFKKLFNHEIMFIKDMDTITFRAHLEELQNIAKEGKVRYYIAKEFDRKRTVKKGEVTGFSPSINADPLAHDAINTVKDRQKRLTAKEKIEAGLIALGIDPKAAASLMSAGVIKARLEDKNKEDFKTKKEEIKEEEKKPFFNPFQKKVE